MTSQGVILFHTMSAALRTEKALVKAGLRVKLVPTPRDLSSDCGFSLRFVETSVQKVESVLLTAGIEYAAVHFPYPPVAEDKVSPDLPD